MLRRKDEMGTALLTTVVPDVTIGLKNAEAQFRAIVALGTLVSSAPPADRSKLSANIELLTKLTSVKDPKAREAAQQLLSLIS